MSTPYHNTNALSPGALREAVRTALTQEAAIFLIYKNQRARFTASDIHGMMERAGWKHPITSTRRAISNLAYDGQLTKLSDMKPGLYGKPESFYVLNFVRYPTPTGTQATLFSMDQKQSA